MTPTNPNSSPTLLQVASTLLRVFEGLQLTAYRDSGGVWTIGYGHTGSDVHEGMVITQAQAERYLQQDSGKLFDAVKGQGNILAQGALVSFGYDCGLGTLEKVLAGHSTLTDFVHDRKGNVLPGLVARRGLEKLLLTLGGAKTS